MGGGGQLTEPVETSACGGRAASVYTWDEVQKHCHRNDQWLVNNRKVYNVTQWAKRHPGGLRVISHYAGEDATVTTAFYNWGFSMSSTVTSAATANKYTSPPVQHASRYSLNERDPQI